MDRTSTAQPCPTLKNIKIQKLFYSYSNTEIFIFFLFFQDIQTNKFIKTFLKKVIFRVC